MSRFSNCLSGGRERGNGMGGYGMRRRDGSCQGQSSGQGKRMDQSRNVSGPGFFNRFFSGGNSTNSANSVSTASGTEALLSAIKDLQQQIDELKNQSGK